MIARQIESHRHQTIGQIALRPGQRPRFKWPFLEGLRQQGIRGVLDARHLAHGDGPAIAGIRLGCDRIGDGGIKRTGVDDLDPRHQQIMGRNGGAVQLRELRGAAIRTRRRGSCAGRVQG